MPLLHTRWNRVLAAALMVVVSAFAVAMWYPHTAAQEADSEKPPVSPTAKRHADSLSQAFRQVAEATVPTVVSIEVKTRARAISRNESRRRNPFEGSPFEDFFGDDFRGFDFDGNQQSFSPPRQGEGSGVIVDPSGIVLTNNHVVEGADEVVVRLSDGREVTATDIKTDPHSDLAVLRIKVDGSLPAARLGDSNALEIGDWVIAVGTPFGLQSTVSAGIISSKARELAPGRRTRFLQTDAAINPGNSGGPLVNLDGEVIGINTAIASSSGGYQGIGFAIPSELAKWVMGQLIEKGEVERAYLGVTVGEIRGQLASRFGVGQGAGVLVSEVLPGSPAADAGFEEGDVITGFAGKKVRTPRDLQELVERSDLGSTQRVQVQRDGESLELKVAVRALPGEQSSDSQSPSQSDGEQASEGHTQRDLGLTVDDMNADVASQLGFKGYQGVLITEVLPDGPAAEVGLSSGMLILKVGKTKVDSVKEFQEAVEEQSSEGSVVLLVRTEGGNRFVVIPTK